MRPKRLSISLLSLVVVAALLGGGAWAAPRSSNGSAVAAPVDRTGGPLFIENAGQWPDAARYQVWGGGPPLWLAEDALWMSVVAGSQVEGSRFDPVRVPGSRLGERNLEPVTLNGVNIRLSFPGANPHPRLEPFDRRDTHVSYFLGNDPAGWRPDVPVWGGVRYVDLYPGVDLELAGVDGRIAPWLVARPGADLAAVRLRVEGTNAVALDGDALRLSTAAGAVRLPLLTAERANVERANVKRLNAQAFDVSRPFVSVGANPQSQIHNSQSGGLLYSSFLGGSSYDFDGGITVTSAGNAYVVGSTYSGDFPTTPGTFDTSYNGYDVFVVKLSSDGSRLIYATFLGGAGYELGWGIAVDGVGSAYVTGETHSGDFPTTPGAFDISYNGGEDTFVVKLTPAGSRLAYATLLGGQSEDTGYAVAVDVAGRAYVTGYTYSHNFPTTPNAFDTSHNDGTHCSCGDAFAVMVDPAGGDLLYATFLGGSRLDYGFAIAVDGAGSAYVTGYTHSVDFPTTPDAFDTSYNGGRCLWDEPCVDAFAIKLDPAGHALVYATYLGGTGDDEGGALAVDDAGSAYITGWTASGDFPTTPGAFDVRHNGGQSDVFIAKLSPSGSALAYATFLGGSGSDIGSGIAVDRLGKAHVTGGTASGDFPTTPGAFDTSYNGGAMGDAFVVTLNPEGSALVYATFLGGTNEDGGGSIALDAAGRAYVLGGTSSSDFPTTPHAFDTSYNGGGTDYVTGDAFVVKLLAGPPPALPALQGAIWHDQDGDATPDAGEPGLAGVRVCAEPLGRRPVRCATSGPDGSYTIELDMAGTYLVAPSAAPAGMRLTTPGFRLPVVVREGEQVWDVDFGYR